MMIRYIKYMGGLLLAGALVACGGGGGSPGLTATGSGDGTTTTTSTTTVVVTVVNSAGAEVTSIDSAGGYKARATVTNLGSAVASTLVTFSVGDAIATLNPSTALTNANGTAEVGIAPASGTTGGATRITATAQIGTNSFSGTKDIGVGATQQSANSTISLQVVNSGGGEVSNITAGGSFSARATLKDATGGPLANRLVTFGTDASLATLTPTTALTNTQGVAQVGIAPSSFNALGAATLTASSNIGTTTLTVTKDFGVSASNLTLSSIALGSAQLVSGGNTSVTVNALLNGAAASTPVNVTFAASCGRIGAGTGNTGSVTTTGNGVASTSYVAVNADGTLCSGPVTISATAAGSASATSTLTVASPSANSVTFVSATPAQVFVAGSGAQEQSLVRYRVFAGTTPLANQQVVFTLAAQPGGVSIGTRGNTAPVTATTDANGEATLTVFSGTIPGPVRVRASLASNGTIFAESQNLSVSSGPPSQRFMSLSVSTFNIEGWDVDGTPTTLTLRVADRQGNPVEDGTVVNFTAEGGQVASSCATAKANGLSLCTVDFNSQNPRPAGGRVSVLAYTSGTKDYVDVNNNNRYDEGVDTLVDMGDAYRDDNENGQYDVGEFSIPRGGSLVCAGSGAPFPSRTNTCDGQLATTVRQQTTILFSSSFAQIDINSLNNAGVVFTVRSKDNVLLPMPAGSTVTVSTIPRTITTTTGTAPNTTTTTTTSTCTVNASSITPTTVSNVTPGVDPNKDLATRHSAQLQGDCAAGDRVLITVTTPRQNKTSLTVGL